MRISWDFRVEGEAPNKQQKQLGIAGMYENTVNNGDVFFFYMVEFVNTRCLTCGEGSFFFSMFVVPRIHFDLVFALDLG